MNILKNNHKLPYILLTVLLVLGALGLTTKRGYAALNGLFWEVNSGRVSLLADKIRCSNKIWENDCKLPLSDIGVNFGVYDPNQVFDNSNLLAYDHNYINWNDDLAINTLEAVFNKSSIRNRWLMLTVEPQPRESGENLFENIALHNYDNQIKKVCQKINDSPTPVLIRWGHEMENVTGRYAWATDNYSDFISSYNYFVDTCRGYTSNAYYVWSPVGNSNLNNYWPEASNVDMIGLSVYAFDDYEVANYKYLRSFDEIFFEKYERVKEYKKPVIVAEIGINKESNAQKYWWFNSTKSFSKYPLLKSVFYFNAKDHANVWGNFDTPDWTISPLLFP